MTSPQDLALAYDRAVAALWREDVGRARAWLAEFWDEHGPPEPRDYPDAVSFLGGAGRGIRWYAAGDATLGYLPGVAAGCYRVPTAATPPTTVVVLDGGGRPTPEAAGAP